MQPFSQSKWIWTAEGQCPDQYVEFIKYVTYHEEREALCRLSCDSDYALYINGELVASNQYGDFEHYKIYDTISISQYLREGENELRFLVYHCGVHTSRYIPAAAGLIFEVILDGCVAAVSEENTLSRQSPTYASGNRVPVSPQLGFTFSYDATAQTREGFAPSVCVEKTCSFYPRPIPKAKLLPRHPVKALIRHSPTHYLIDLGGEVVGLPTLDIVSQTEQTITVAWGEVLRDGSVPMKISGRNFFFTYKTQRGENRFTEPMLRLGCRYLEVFAEDPIELRYVGILPQVYETAVKPCRFEKDQDRKIYDICVNTLKLCMMEHYVDCPWREQAMYVYDSRNQMLCGYYAFEDGNVDYARANLKLIGQDRRADGLLPICTPAGKPLAIPCFSLYYFFSVKEYLDHTQDVGLVKELLPRLSAICRAFLSNREEGLLREFAGEEMWNFYDWSKHCDGTQRKNDPVTADLVLNCLFVLALDKFEKLCAAAEEVFPYPGMAQQLRQRIREHFRTQDGLFTMRRGYSEFTVLGNSLVILADVVTDQEAMQLCDKILSGELVDCSLSMKILEYEALLKTDAQTYRDEILAQIRENYQIMLSAGSDTVWETLQGADAFGKAGSLCHGWSAVPVYIYHKLGIAK